MEAKLRHLVYVFDMGGYCVKGGAIIACPIRRGRLLHQQGAHRTQVSRVTGAVTEAYNALSSAAEGAEGKGFWIKYFSLDPKSCK